MKPLYLLATIVALGVLVGGIVVWLGHRPDCAFSGWRRTVGVDLDVAVADLNAVKGKVGISDDVARDFDQVLKDYAVKFDTACQDVRAGRMSRDVYTCRRANMDRALDSIRTFVQAVQAAKSLSDPSTQKQIILKAYEDLRTASNAGYRTGCTSAMSVSPRRLTFDKGVPERSLRIVNYGNTDFRFAVTDLPESFSAIPTVDYLRTGASSTVVIFRTVIPPKGDQTIRFHVLDSLQDDLDVELNWGRESAELYQTWNERLALYPSKNRDVAQNALRLTSLYMSEDIPEERREVLNYILAAGLLEQAGQPEKSLELLATAGTKERLRTGRDVLVERQVSGRDLVFRSGGPDDFHRLILEVPTLKPN